MKQEKLDRKLVSDISDIFMQALHQRFDQQKNTVTLLTDCTNDGKYVPPDLCNFEAGCYNVGPEVHAISH